MTAADYKPEVGAWVLNEHKNRGKGKSRIIYLTTRLVSLTEQLAAKWPEGPLFRNRSGKPWRRNTVVSAFLRLRKKLGLNKVTAYSLRHKFATEYLLAGGSMAYVAQLQGNSVAVCERHYVHLREHGAELRAKLLAFRPGDTAVEGAAALDSGSGG